MYIKAKASKGKVFWVEYSVKKSPPLSMMKKEWSKKPGHPRYLDTKDMNRLHFRRGNLSQTEKAEHGEWETK